MSLSTQMGNGEFNAGGGGRGGGLTLRWTSISPTDRGLKILLADSVICYSLAISPSPRGYIWDYMVYANRVYVEKLIQEFRLLLKKNFVACLLQ